MPGHVTVYEVGPRDGLQNEAASLSTPDKLALVRALADAGLRRIEATSFVSPRWIPQLADADPIVSALPRAEGVTYVVLVPNAKGLERLVEALRRAGDTRPEVAAAVFMSASESHNRKNLNRTVAESLRELEDLVPAARARGLRVRGYVSTVFGCPYEGAVEPERAAAVAERLLSFGCEQISLGDTIGVATPAGTRRVLERLLRVVPPDQLALHMHDTRGTALANVLAGLELGIATFDASIGGLGGCPYAPGASGNLATEDLVYMLHGMGYETGVDFAKLIAAGALAQRLVGRRLPGKTLQAELARTEA
ncbi:MAG TPA: hydroxymethylglutaryl-CoA lyase [Anaeromyxobacter sp.]